MQDHQGRPLTNLQDTFVVDQETTYSQLFVKHLMHCQIMETVQRLSEGQKLLFVFLELDHSTHLSNDS